MIGLRAAAMVTALAVVGVGFERGPMAASAFLSIMVLFYTIPVVLIDRQNRFCLKIGSASLALMFLIYANLWSVILVTAISSLTLAAIIMIATRFRA